MQYLVDSNILREGTRPRSAPAVIEWLLANEGEIVVNPIVLGELRYGILQLSASRRRTRLEQWFTGGLKRLHVLPLDTATAEVWARLLAELSRKGKSMSMKDSLIAATARQHGLTVATRDTRDFANAGVNTINPFEF